MAAGSTESIDSPAASRRGARIFVGSKIAPEIARELARIAQQLEHFDIRPVATDDIHLTLVPPWEDASPPDAIEKLGAIAARFDAFVLTIEHVGYGPNPRRPRLLWADCAATDQIATLRAALLRACGQSDERPFHPHVTLARIRGNGFAIARRHPIDQELSLTQRIESIELFQSPPPGERGYRVLASLPLGETAARRQ
jgi:2'-5' RNA ligase